MPTQEDSTHEREMARLNNSAVMFKNIDDEDFEHRYDGVPFQVRAGETAMFTYPVGMLLARHLAMRILRKEAEKMGQLRRDKDAAGRQVNLFPESKILEIVAKIIKERIDRPVAPRMTAGEIEKQKQAELQKEFGSKLTDANAEVTKKQISEDMTKRGIKHNIRDSRENLLKLLLESEAKGDD